MGTTAEVSVGGLSDPDPALDAAFAALARVDARMSLWKESELQALNDAGHGVVSRDTFAVIRHALDVAAASGGAFDPTVEPLVRAAGGFGGGARELGAAERRCLLRRVGYKRVHLNDEETSVRLDTGTRLVLDGLAKGYAVDLALRALREAGASRGLVDLGGSSLAVFGHTVTLELDDPTGEGGSWATLTTAAAVGTSAIRDGPSPIFDARTGEPPRGVLQATVLASSALEADALSTTVLVLGAEKGLALVRQRDAAGLALVLEEGRRVIQATPGFTQAHALVPASDVELRE